jgi:hypothetical protein
VSSVLWPSGSHCISPGRGSAWGHAVRGDGYASRWKRRLRRKRLSKSQGRNDDEARPGRRQAEEVGERRSRVRRGDVLGMGRWRSGADRGGPRPAAATSRRTTARTEP